MYNVLAEIRTLRIGQSISRSFVEPIGNRKNMQKHVRNISADISREHNVDQSRLYSTVTMREVSEDFKLAVLVVVVIRVR